MNSKHFSTGGVFKIWMQGSVRSNNEIRWRLDLNQRVGSQPGHEKPHLFQSHANNEERQFRMGKSQKVWSSGSVCLRNEAKVEVLLWIFYIALRFANMSIWPNHQLSWEMAGSSTSHLGGTTQIWASLMASVGSLLIRNPLIFLKC